MSRVWDGWDDDLDIERERQMAHLAGRLAQHDQMRSLRPSLRPEAWRVPDARPAKGILPGILLGSLVFAALGACLWALFG